MSRLVAHPPDLARLGPRDPAVLAADALEPQHTEHQDTERQDLAPEDLAPEVADRLPRWRRRLCDDLMRPSHSERMKRGAAHEDLRDFADDIAHEQIEVLAHQLLGGDLSLWASARGDADRAAALRAIECDLLAHVHHEVEVARARILQATLPAQHRRPPRHLQPAPHLTGDADERPAAVEDARP